MRQAGSNPGLRRNPSCDEAGFTIVETATMLMVMFILAGALAPIVSESVDTARAVKAANDAQVIASGMIQFERDLGPSAIAYGSGSYGAGTGLVVRQSAAPQVLISDGEAPRVDGEAPGDTPDFRKRFALKLNTPDQATQQSSRAARQAWLDAAAAFIEDHLITNRAGYRMRKPHDVTGWNGPYISSLIKSDPWGHRYFINCQWLDGSASAADQNGQPRRAVFIVSAGANGIIETPFDQPLSDAHLYGDDLGVRIQ